MFTKEDYDRLPIDVVVNLINQLEEERDMYRDKWRKVGKMYSNPTIHVTTQKEIDMQKANSAADCARMHSNPTIHVTIQKEIDMQKANSAADCARM